MVVSGALYTVALLYTMISCKTIQKIRITYNHKNLSCIQHLFSFVVVFWPLVCIYGFRVNVGVDYPQYLMYYNYFKTAINSWSSILAHYLEPGYIILNKIGFAIFNDDYAVFLVTGIVIFGLLYLVTCQYKHIVNSPILIYIFFMVHFGASCNIVRQSMAMMMVAVGYRYVLEKKYLKFLLICLVASTLHKSAIICILIILFDRFYDYIKDKIKGFIIVFSVILVFVGQYVMNVISSLLLFKQTYIRAGLNIYAFLFLLYLLPEIFFIEKYKSRLIENNKCYERLISLFYLQIPFQLLDIYSLALQRVSIYFSILKIIIIPAIVNSYKDRRNYGLLKTMVFLWYLLFFIMTEIVLTGNGLFPYDFFYDFE